MSVQSAADGTILLNEDCRGEDAEVLLQLLAANPAAMVDMRDCESAHSAVIQVLLAAKPRIIGPPVGAALRHWVYPLLAE